MLKIQTCDAILMQEMTIFKIHPNLTAIMVEIRETKFNERFFVDIEK